MGLEDLKAKYAWPVEMPRVNPDAHGWFGECNEHVLSLFLNKETTVVLELGSWLGKSTRFILHKANRATVFAVDHWQGTKQITDDEPACATKLPTLYDTFLVNCWAYRDRLVPMKANTVDAMAELYNAQVVPDVVYLDAAHDFESANADLDAVIKFFPNAVIVGDDFSPKWDGVMRAVWQHAETTARGVIFASHAWAMLGPWRDGALTKLKR